MTAEQPEEREALLRWLGTWEAAYQVVFSDGEVHPGAMTVVATPMANGQGVHMDAKGTVTDLEDWEAHALWGYDAESGEVHWFAVSSMGEVHDHAGVWKDENTLALEWRGVEEGEAAVEHTTFRWNSPSEVAMETILTVGGKLSHTLKGTWTRQRKP